MWEGEFLSIVSHELTAPIAVIAGLADTLSERRHNLTEEQIDHCLDRISRQGDRLARLVADLLDLSQVESGSALSRSILPAPPRRHSRTLHRHLTSPSS